VDGSCPRLYNMPVARISVARFGLRSNRSGPWWNTPGAGLRTGRTKARSLLAPSLHPTAAESLPAVVELDAGNGEVRVGEDRCLGVYPYLHAFRVTFLPREASDGVLF
jgi:hypothetical protein